MKLALLAIATALVLGGCGGTSTATGSLAAADVLPADTAGYVELDTDLGSAQWHAVQSLLDRFPSKPQLVAELNEQLRSEGLEYERDVAPAVGDVLVVAYPAGTRSEENAVVLTQPHDEQKWRALVDKADADHEHAFGEVDGWNAAALRASSIAALQNGGGSLEDDDAFQDAVADLPDERLALGFARGEVLDRNGRTGQELRVDWVAGAVEARDDGASVVISAHGEGADTGAAISSKRIHQAPADALAFLSFNANAIQSQASTLRPYAQMLGLPIDELASQLRGEGAVWVRAGASPPEITLVVEVADAVRARATLQELLSKVPLAFHVAIVNGDLVATTAPNPASALASGSSLADAPDFEAASDAADLPDETSGLFYVNVADAVPLLGLAAATGASVPKELVDNLRPIRAVVGWGERDGAESRFQLFVQIQ